MEQKKDRHHRINKKMSRNGCRSDPIMVNAERHRKFHALFGDMDAQQIANDLNKYWIDSNLYMIVVPRRRVI